MWDLWDLWDLWEVWDLWGFGENVPEKLWQTLKVCQSVWRKGDGGILNWG